MQDSNNKLSLSYVPEVDALRCLAVMMVFIFHDRLLPFGWGGVWFFFVISGFAITTSLLISQDHSNNRWQIIKNFYIKRTLRIWPLYYLYIAACYVAISVWGNHPSFERIPYLLTFTYNFNSFADFQNKDDAAGKLFGHLWTLSTEEQFYVLFPLAFLLLSRRALVLILGSVILISPILRLWLGNILAKQNWNQEDIGRTVYFFGPAQFDAFAAGVLIALFREKIEKNRSFAVISALTAIIACIVYCVGYFIVGLRQPGGFAAHRFDHIFSGMLYGQYREVFAYSVLGIIGAALLIGVLTPARCQLHKAFIAACRFGFAQKMGKISYGIYMFHPAILFIIWTYLGVDNEGIGLTSKWIRIMVLIVAMPSAICVSHLSYKYFENRFLRPRKDIIDKESISVVATVLTAI